ncbi:acyl carrier protein [Mucilaginibacter sp. OK268]|uniref:acyl carrier protein n=1 Tax=Mucilaginibacter sp. OK268 TaxID=1881048 RepID=UPI00088ADAC6|nr:phosphopantetheine-binding protein [Mucilaginibacter sp. OK268]SDP53159.1 acyl carrier protein [Mucilaginibacter sp. OK268]
MSDVVFNKLKKIIDKILGIEDGRIVITPATRFDDLCMDNYEVMEIRVQIEIDFDISIPEEELVKFVTVNDMAAYLDKQLTR